MEDLQQQIVDDQLNKVTRAKRLRYLKDVMVPGEDNSNVLEATGIHADRIAPDELKNLKKTVDVKDLPE